MRSPLHVHDHDMFFLDRHRPLRVTYVCTCGHTTESLEAAVLSIQHSRKRRGDFLLYTAFAIALTLTVWVMP
jgi:hypothetical protein